MILVSFLEKFNINILAAYYYIKPEQLLIVDHPDFGPQRKALKQYFSKDNIKFIKDLSSIDRNDIVWNVSGDSRLDKYEVFKNNYDNGHIIYFSEDLKEGYEVKNGMKESIDVSEIYLNVEDYVEAMGGAIVHEATSIYEDEDIIGLLEWQKANYSQWKMLKSYLRRPGVVKFSATSSRFVEIRKTKSRGIQGALGQMINEIQKLKSVKVTSASNYSYILSLSNPNLKNYLAVSGAWLEALTYHTLKDIDVVDAVNGGVQFLWNEKDEVVRNEVDVMAVNDLRLFSISCKDTSKYNEWTLNELETYGDLVGGSKSVKILVTTALPQKEIIINRCREMKIELVLFEGDQSKFKNSLEDIVSDYS